jgi:hypothetical protein
MALAEVQYKVAGFPVVYEDLDDATPARGTWDAAREADNANRALNDPDVMAYLGPFNSGCGRCVDSDPQPGKSGDDQPGDYLSGPHQARYWRGR